MECTPRFIGFTLRCSGACRRPAGCNVTNTGCGGSQVLPGEAATADRIANLWPEDWKQGFRRHGCRPGFLKLGTAAALVPRWMPNSSGAAARVHRATPPSPSTLAMERRDEARLLAEEKSGPTP
ncbi:MAG: hypothetical protein KIT22_04185 [Verrucomicrobiae bacterium]|nr:hypothetical protein [Verrucomicrobiae bacterium]